jgi:hypothetical protein
VGFTARWEFYYTVRMSSVRTLVAFVSEVHVPVHVPAGRGLCRLCPAICVTRGCLGLLSRLRGAVLTFCKHLSALRGVPDACCPNCGVLEFRGFGFAHVRDFAVLTLPATPRKRDRCLRNVETAPRNADRRVRGMAVTGFVSPRVIFRRERGPRVPGYEKRLKTQTGTRSEYRREKVWITAMMSSQCSRHNKTVKPAE